MELYEKFFANALKKDAERLGIVYTPVEVVDFILHSADEVLREEFGRSLSDEGVHLLDPFAGAGVFLSRLLQSKLIKDSDLERKYREELHANEIVLLAYYIAAVNIEEAYRGRRGEDSGYETVRRYRPDGYVQSKQKGGRCYAVRQSVDARQQRPRRTSTETADSGHRRQPALVRQGRGARADDNPNVGYPELQERIENTYAASSSATLKRYLYDSYKLAIRWASDRIKETGIIAFVSNASWIDGNGDAGIRACLAEEFSSAYVFNLRGNARTSGELRRREGDNVFGQGSRAPVAITILVKNSNAANCDCRIHYRDIGDYLSKEEKLAVLNEARSIAELSDWQEITPDGYHDWIQQRNDAFAQFYALGSKDAKAGRADDAIFRLYSLGLATGKDAYIYNFSRDVCAEIARRMTQDYLAAISAIKANPKLTVGEVTRRHSSNLKWDRELEKNLKRGIRPEFKEEYIRKVVYRPFIATNCYLDYTFIQMKLQMDRIFPDGSSQNRVICVPGKGLKNLYSVIMVDTMSDLNLTEAGAQCFPRYCYPKSVEASEVTHALQEIEETLDRIDNISDTALRAFRENYRDDAITKDAIFYYVYGILNAPTYRKEFANDLSKELPRIPFAPDFRVFAEAGKALGELHVGYESCERHPLELVYAHEGEPQARHFRLTEKAMRFADDEKTTLRINEHVSLSGIPAEAHRYVVNGRTPLEWYIDRYRIKRDKESGIVNDPNGWFEDPRDLVAAIERIVHVSVESTRIIEGLPREVIGSPQQ